MPVQDDVLVIENPDLLQAVEKAPQDVKAFLFDAMTDVVFMIQGEVGYASYPPATEANQPGRVDANGEPMGYYERGRGWWYPVKNAATLGGVNSVSGGAQDVNGAYRRHKLPTKSIETLKTVRTLPGRRKKKNGVWITESVTYVDKSTPVVAGYKLAKNKNGQPGTSERLGASWTTNVESGPDYVSGEVGTPVTYADYTQGYQVPALFTERGWEDMPERLKRLEPQITKRFDQAVLDYLERFGE